MKKESIKALRKGLGLNTKDFGELFPVTAHTISNWEQGIRNPSRVSLRILEDLIKQQSNK